MNYLILLLLSCGFTWLDANPNARVEKARATQAEKVVEAFNQLNDQLDELLKATAGKADLRLAKLLQQQIEQFQAENKLPTMPITKRAVAEYRGALDSAREELIRALKLARDELTRQQDFDAAELLDAEVEMLVADRPHHQRTINKQHVKDQEDDAKTYDEMKVGSIWRGTLTQQWRKSNNKTDTNQKPAEMRIMERSGNQFKARIEVQGGYNVREVYGTVSGTGLVRMPASTMEIKQGIGKIFDHYGRTRGNSIHLEFSGINWEGQFTRGYYSFELSH